MKRVVITGIGAVTPLGNDMESTWEHILNGRSGISRISKFDPSGLRSQIGGEIRGFDPGVYMPQRDINRYDPFVHYACASASMAIRDSGITEVETLKRTPVIIGSSRGGISSIERGILEGLSGGRRASPYLMSATTINMAASYISMKIRSKALTLGVSTACASGASAISEAYRLIKTGYADVVIAGGSDAPICRLALSGYSASGALSMRNDDPHRASRPFDSERDGFVISEGACVVVLESLRHAEQRGAPRIYAEVLGCGVSSDAHHPVRPSPEGESYAIRVAMDEAGIDMKGIDYINAHATSTRIGDRIEAEAIRMVFGRRAGDIPVSSIKSMLGHMLGASGALEVAVTALSISEGVIPPNINLQRPEPQIGLRVVTSTTRFPIGYAMTNTFGFGGINVVFILGRIG